MSTRETQTPYALTCCPGKGGVWSDGPLEAWVENDGRTCGWWVGVLLELFEATPDKSWKRISIKNTPLYATNAFSHIHVQIKQTKKQVHLKSTKLYLQQPHQRKVCSFPLLQTITHYFSDNRPLAWYYRLEMSWDQFFFSPDQSILYLLQQTCTHNYPNILGPAHTTKSISNKKCMINIELHFVYQ